MSQNFQVNRRTTTKVTIAKTIKAMDTKDDNALDVFEESFQGIRVDEDTKQGSVLDVARIVTGLPSNDARKYAIAAAKELGIAFPQLRINGKGRETPVADAKTLIQIVWELPGKAARAFRRQCANYICRVLGGDPSLVTEMELRAKHTPGAQKDFFMQNTEVPDIFPFIK
jgi:hypothetical protein